MSSCQDIQCEYYDGEDTCYVHESLCPFHQVEDEFNECKDCKDFEREGNSSMCKHCMDCYPPKKHSDAECFPELFREQGRSN